MSWGAVIAGGVALVGSVASSQSAKKGAESAGKREGEASEAALARSAEAFEMGEAALTPYARQEQAASTQLMAQMGLAPPGGGGAGGGGDGGWGFGMGPGAAKDKANTTDFLQNILGQQIVDSFRSGHHRSKGLAEGARRTEKLLKEMQRNGELPEGFEIPSVSELTTQTQQMYADYGGNYNAMVDDYGGEGGARGAADVTTLMGEYGIGGDVQAGGPGGQVPGGGEMMLDGEAPGAPGPQTISDIMGRAGAAELPPEIRDQYMQDLMGTQVDPNEYQQTGAYQAAREAGVEAVDAGAAASGGLYSGARGEALRDVGQGVEQQYFQMHQQQRNLETARRGAAYETDQNRGQSYYNNYMQMLTGMSNPTTTTNIEAMRAGAAQAEGATLMGTARSLGDLDIGAAGAESAAYADLAGAGMKIGEAFIGRDRNTGTAPNNNAQPYMNASSY